MISRVAYARLQSVRMAWATVLAVAATAGPGLGQSAPAVSVTQLRQDAAHSTYFVTLSNVQTVTISVEMQLRNATASERLPMMKTINGAGPAELLTVSQNDPSLPWSYTLNYHWAVGPLKTDAISAYDYALPYSTDTRRRVIQGFFGAFSHQRGSEHEYAIDFSMPIGSPISAARAGRVIATKDDSRTGGPTKDYADFGNYIYIAHDDGTYALYEHLSYRGVRVHMGDSVQQGDLIGYSGNTGFSATPHLHFEVFVNRTTTRHSIPIAFRFRTGQVGALEQGGSY